MKYVLLVAVLFSGNAIAGGIAPLSFYTIGDQPKIELLVGFEVMTHNSVEDMMNGQHQFANNFEWLKAAQTYQTCKRLCGVGAKTTYLLKTPDISVKCECPKKKPEKQCRKFPDGSERDGRSKCK